MRTVRRLRLRCLVFGTALSCCLFQYLTMSKPCHPHRSILTGGINLGSSLPYYNTLRWRCRESNPGPQCLPYGGITTILYNIYDPTHHAFFLKCENCYCLIFSVWWALKELNFHSIDYESIALPLS